MIPDARQRREAVLTSGHAFVWASAGTGKTHTLTLRALYLLLTAPFDSRAQRTECRLLYGGASRAERLRAARAVLRRFVLTTFTRKAAAEMQTRLYGYLDALASAASLTALRERFPNDRQLREVVEATLGRLGGGEPFSRLQAGAEALGELATELRVCTLHSFAASLLQRHSIAAGIPPLAQFAEEDDPTLMNVGSQVVERWWQKVLAEPELLQDLEALIPILPQEDMREWFEAIYQHRRIADEMDFPAPDNHAIHALLAASRQLAQELAGAPSRATRVIQAGRELQAILASISNGQAFAWRDFCGYLERQSEVLFSSKRSQAVQKAIAALGAGSRFYEDDGLIYELALQKCLAEEYPEDWARWRRLAGRFAKWAEDAAVRELGVVTFDDMVRLAARLLRENDAVRREEREQLWAILVDEFQDTDPLQLDLLESLLRRQPGDPELMGFFVGDLKQSIYRFRGADLPAIRGFVSRYSQVVQSTEVGEFQLTANFRSRPPITKFVNYFFERCVPLPNYPNERLEPVRKGATPMPEWRRLALAQQRGAVGARLESAGRETVRLIAEHHDQSGQDDAAYRDIIVLVSTHDELDMLLPLLEKAGIPAVSGGARTFCQQPEVLDVLNLLIAAQNPLDTLATGALLRSPLFGLSDVQIYGLLARLEPGEIFHGDAALPADLPAPARGRIEQLRRLVRERPGTALAMWLSQLREFIPMGLYAQQNIEGRGVARIDQVLAAFRRAVELGSLPPISWLLEQRDRARDRFDAKPGEDVSVTDESTAAVRVLTIHKAKGLQGKYVIVLGWQKALDKLKPREESSCHFQLTDADGHTVGGFKLPWGRLEVVSTDYRKAQKLNQQYEAEEAQRLLYVAATRAEDRLVLLSPHCQAIPQGQLAEIPSPLQQDGGAGEACGGTLEVIVTLPPEPIQRPSGSAVRLRSPDAYAQLWRARLERAAGEAEPLLHQPSRLEPVEAEDKADLPDYVREKIDMASARAMELGTVVHRYLERHLQEPGYDAAKLEAVVSEINGGVSFPETIEKARVVLTDFYGGALHQRACRGRIEAREAPVFASWEGKAWSGVIDLVLREGDAVIGVDYKVMKMPKQLPAEYEQQRRVYQEVLRRLFPGQPVSFEFWWLINSPR